MCSIAHKASKVNLSNSFMVLTVVIVFVFIDTRLSYSKSINKPIALFHILCLLNSWSFQDYYSSRNIPNRLIAKIYSINLKKLNYIKSTTRGMCNLSQCSGGDSDLLVSKIYSYLMFQGV